MTGLHILIACEFSNRVRDAFRKRGHKAVSCDFEDGADIQDDVLNHINAGWDMMIAHPPCTYLTVSANKWMKSEYRDKYPTRLVDREKAVEFFMALYNANIPKIAVENPIGIMSTRFRKPDQIVQPWMFGHPETKATCLWLKGLPLLTPTNIVLLPEKRSERMKMHYLPKTPNRWKLRSITYEGIAEAMASQWG